MPLYEFKCHKCKEYFELRLEVKDRDDLAKTTCPKCGHTSQRQLSSPPQIWLTVGRAKKTTYPPSELGPSGDIE